MLTLSVLWNRTLKIFAGLMGVYSLLRLFFYLTHMDVFVGVEWREIIEAFIHGLRFDMVAVVFSNFPVFLLLLFPPIIQEMIWFQRLKLLLFISLNLIFVSCNLADIELYQFTGRRMTLELFNLADDIQDQIWQMALYYWYLTFAAVVIGYGLYRLFPHYNMYQVKEVRPLWKRTMGGVLLLLMLTVAARGGLQLKPLKTTNAFIFSHEALGVLSLNTTFTLLRTNKGEELKKRSYFIDESEIGEILPAPVVWPHAPTHENVVLIVLESFALEFMGLPHEGKGYTPFLDDLALRSYFFRNSFANGRRSIEAIPSLLSGLPSWLQDPFITSSLSSNNVEGLGHVLKKEGYQTAFFHGAENGTMYFDSYAQRTGFDHYFGLNEYPNRADFDGNWGIYDEPFLKFTVDQLSKMQTPFGVVVFTLSSHQPYSVPQKYAGRFPKGTLEIHESIGYTDFALKKFFAYAEKQDWYKNTLFVLTADHTTKSDRPGYEDVLGRYRVPIMFFHPGRLLPETDPAQPVQHVDVPLSIMHVLGLRPEKWTRLGHSVFDSQTSWVMNRSESAFWYLDRDFFLLWSEGKGADFHSHEDTRGISPLKFVEESNERRLNRRLHALLQYFFNGMMGNNLSVEIPADPN